MNRLALAGLCAVSATVAACGHQASPQPLANNVSQVLQSRSTAGLLAGFDRVHKAIFATIDTNHDGHIDEYEAGPTMSLDSFHKADLNMDDGVDYNEFVAYATDNGWLKWIPGFGHNDTREKFASRFRTYLADRLYWLDSNGDGFLANRELSNRDLDRVELGLDYPGILKRTVRIKAVSDAEFKAADRTGDGKLGPAEFEDMFMDLVVAQLTPAPTSASTIARAAR